MIVVSSRPTSNASSPLLDCGHYGPDAASTPRSSEREDVMMLTHVREDASFSGRSCGIDSFPCAFL